MKIFKFQTERTCFLLEYKPLREKTYHERKKNKSNCLECLWYECYYENHRKYSSPNSTPLNPPRDPPYTPNQFTQHCYNEKARSATQTKTTQLHTN